jgi:glutamate N-acetyltransferase/amino-acid N-acetyltransferase
LDAITEKLAMLLLKDGEGATKLVKVVVRGAKSRRDAMVAARSVANSPLVKTAINGQDPNWGRIMMAVGKSPALVRADRVAIWFDDEPVVVGGQLRQGAKLDRVREIMARPEFTIQIDLGLGRGEAQVWTCDLSEEYVRVNAKYTT